MIKGKTASDKNPHPIIEMGLALILGCNGPVRSV